LRVPVVRTLPKNAEVGDIILLREGDWGTSLWIVLEVWRFGKKQLKWIKF